MYVLITTIYPEDAIASILYKVYILRLFSARANVPTTTPYAPIEHEMTRFPTPSCDDMKQNGSTHSQVCSLPVVRK